MTKQPKSIRIDTEAWSALRNRGANVSGIINDYLIKRASKLKDDNYAKLFKCIYCNQSMPHDQAFCFPFQSEEEPLTFAMICSVCVKEVQNIERDLHPEWIKLQESGLTAKQMDKKMEQNLHWFVFSWVKVQMEKDLLGSPEKSNYLYDLACHDKFVNFKVINSCIILPEFDKFKEIANQYEEIQ